MSSKIHIFKLLVCVWCNCVDPSIHVSTMPYTCVSRFRHRVEGCDHITPPESECMTTQCRAIQPQAHVINHSGSGGLTQVLPASDAHVLSWDSERCLTPADSVHRKTLKKYEGIRCLIFKFTPGTKAMWWTRCRGTMTPEEACLWILVSERPGFKYQLCHLPAVWLHICELLFL